MYSWRNFIDKFKRYGKLERSEKIGLLLTIIVLGFIFSFREWGTEKFDYSSGLWNFFIVTILVAIAFLVHEVAHRTIALWLGYKSTYKVWLVGLVAGLIVAFVSNGRLLFLATGGLLIAHLEIHRLGKGYYELNMKHLGWIAMSGPIANMIFAAILKGVHSFMPLPIIQKLMIINIWIALFDMLPIPPFNGSKTFFGSRFIYIFVVAALVGCALLLTLASGLLSIIGALIIGALMAWIFFAYIDKRW